MENTNITVIRKLASEKDKHTALRIMLFLYEHANEQKTVTCSNNTICELTGLKPTSVTQGVTYLKKKQYIKTYKAGSTNIYIINDGENEPEIVHYDKDVSYIDSRVIFSKNEQKARKSKKEGNLNDD